MRKGFTLIELLIVISIIMVLAAFVLINVRGQIARANDAKRKNDLYTLHNAIEEYFNDNNVFPPADSIQNCGANLSQYVKNIPCDPKTRSPYGYFPSASTGGYRVCAILEDTHDPVIAATGCGGPTGCGLPGGFNYCLAQGTTASAVGTADAGGSVGGVVGGGKGWACAPIDQFGNRPCRYYENPDGSKCPMTYPHPGCNNACQSDSAPRCEI